MRSLTIETDRRSDGAADLVVVSDQRRIAIGTLTDEASVRLFWEALACAKAAAKEAGRQGL